MLLARVEPATVHGCLSISDQELGEHYLSAQSFFGPDVYAVHGLLGREVVGFALGQIFDHHQFIHHHAMIMKHFPAHLMLTHGNIGVFSAMAVRKAYQRQGIGSLLAQCLLGHFDAGMVPLVIIAGWAAPDGVHIDRLAHEFGFSGQAMIHDYWLEDSVARGYQCPVCGDPPCRCSAVLYVRQ